MENGLPLTLVISQHKKPSEIKAALALMTVNKKPT